MALSLQTAPAARGAAWLRDGFRLFGKYPLPFSLMLVVFLSATVLTAVVPLLGPLLFLAALPLLSLGFMLASEAALRDAPVHPGHFIAPLRPGAPGQRSLLLLCALYAVCTLAALFLSNWVDGGSFERLQRLLGDSKKADELEALLEDPQLAWGMSFRIALFTLLSVPFWHAPALIHWNGQGLAQSLFSSSVAVWRNRGAFATYSLAWFGIVVVFGVVTALALALLGLRGLFGLVAMPAALIFSTVFYVSLIFSFHDCFGGHGRAAPPP